MKRYKRQFLFLLCLCTFSAVIGTEALADMKTVAADQTEDLTEIIPEQLSVTELTEAEGEVCVEPEFSWLDEKQESFRLSYTVTNQSDMVIPETELCVCFPETGVLRFDSCELTEAGETDVRLNLEQDQSCMKLFVSDFPIQAICRVTAAGRAKRGGAVRAEKQIENTVGAEGVEVQDGELSAAEEMEISLILRGYGLEHSNRELFDIPLRERAVQLRRSGILVINLMQSGKVPMQELMLIGSLAGLEKSAYGKSSRRRPALFTAQSGEEGHRKLHFLSLYEKNQSGGAARVRMIFVSLLIALFSFAISERICTRRALRRAERQRSFSAISKQSAGDKN
ncbi:hypothetical protein J2S20_000940 [Moryella indoligenes]|uniref:Uncharacterized protein n=1 Tax=Moryella indoligenes TaxID=371674 RepID=A0AAE3VAC7_9FIRM|nr:hypothetical protein [Moryella indoligenes]MDQ0152255.1 hypothetical protein [Moryella indoligenes]